MKGKVITGLFITLIVLSVVGFASANVLDDFFGLFKPKVQLSPGSTFTGLPEGFSPTAGYYNPFGDGVIGLWQGNEYYTSEDGTNFQKYFNPIGTLGLPISFIPDVVYAHDIQGGLIGLWDNSQASGNKYYIVTFSKGVASKLNLNGIPAEDNIILGYWHKFGGVGRVTLFNDRGEAYLWDSSQGTISKLNRDTLAGFGLPSTNLFPTENPQVAYYYNFNGMERVDIWYDDVLFRSTGGDFVEVKTITGISGIPKVGYWDQKRNKLVVWVDNKVFESLDGNIFVDNVVPPVDEEDLVNAEWAHLSLTSVETTATSTTFTYETSNGQTKSGATSTSDKISGTCTSGSADVNRDGVVNALDIQMVINNALSVGNYGTCDINSDGVVNAFDIQMVINGALGIGNENENIKGFEGLPWKYSPIGGFYYGDINSNRMYLFDELGRYFIRESIKDRDALEVIDSLKYRSDNLYLPNDFSSKIGYSYYNSNPDFVLPREILFIWGINGEKFDPFHLHELVSPQDIINSGIPREFNPLIIYYFPRDNSISLWDGNGRLFVSYDFEETFEEVSIIEQIEMGLPTSSQELRNIPLKGYSFNFRDNFQGIDLWYNFNGRVSIYRSLDGINFDEVFLNLPFMDELPHALYFDEIRNSIILWYGPIPYESINGKDFYEVPTTSYKNYNPNIHELNLPSECKGVRYSGGGIENKVNIVFVPSGFNGDMEKFRDEVFKTLNNFENYAPFNSNIEELNVFYVEKESDLNNFCSRPIPFSQHFLPCNIEIAKELSSTCVNGLHETIVVVNENKFGGAGLFWPTNFHVSSFSLDRTDYVAVHELSHILFSFGDEYVQGNYYSDDATSNCDVAGCPKWNDLIEEFEDVGCYPGFCTNGNYYVASEHSIMFDGNSYSLNQQRDACCTYKELSGSYPESLCSQFQNNFNLINLDNYCSSQKSLEFLNSIEKSNFVENQEIWEAPLEDGTFSIEVIDKSQTNPLQIKSWQCFLPWNWFGENCF